MPGMVSTIASALIGVSVGGIITYLLSRHYYRRATEDLRREAGKLRSETERARTYINALISYLEAADAIRVSRDPETGDPLEVQFLRVPTIRSEEVFGEPGASAPPAPYLDP